MKRSCSIVTILYVATTVRAFAPAPLVQSSCFFQRQPTTTARFVSGTAPPSSNVASEEKVDAISEAHRLKVLIAGAGVGGLSLAKVLTKMPTMDVTVLEQTSEFKRFGGPIQLASNAMEILKHMDKPVFDKVMEKFTFTGDKENGIKDGIRTEWYAKFDLKTPAENRNMPYTGVIERPDLQQIFLDSLPKGTVKNGDGVARYEKLPDGGVKAVLKSGKEVYGDVLIGADGIWSAVRATMRDSPAKGDGSGATYSGYTVFAGELAYDSFDNGQVGYKVYIGPGQYFVITDIGNGNYQWYAFLARPADSASSTDMPDGQSKYLQEIFAGWSEEVHHILRATQEHEIEQRDLYDRPPSAMKPWTDGPVALLGDGVHAMMPNLGQGGCQAIEDAFVIGQELGSATKRSQIVDKLREYQQRRLIRSAAVQGLSRFASDIIIRGFDTPAKIYRDENGKFQFENCNYAGIVTKILQPILPIFFSVQFAFLYDGWKNDKQIDFKAFLGFSVLGGLIVSLVLFELAEAGLGIGLGAEALLGAEGLLDFGGISAAIQDFFLGGGAAGL
ncbi:zeaxanthin epoxidase [Phaeodactylum tricornutum CCAP 1055/1]|uniref:Zeaxanthin epoxidase n=1 Tax=Phaeodactylum tricornutum (strain CCAP 1055/1) TaxID=556484 RepID=B7FUR7_PHATC|nr:zeaxanthin epoxidase [Phaeodactylum tricornutum CCAP 1055/1]EEC50032.1 zeaxanthin epoxidase [Phaeodactylum tricornutum CCAP 1055/1]|eukprot:XP_002178367.1 zeaxanthin epoxidase [Phaeodactylum tricornutum CCAP 1055/1]